MAKEIAEDQWYALIERFVVAQEAMAAQSKRSVDATVPALEAQTRIQQEMLDDSRKIG